MKSHLHRFSALSSAALSATLTAALSATHSLFAKRLLVALALVFLLALVLYGAPEFKEKWQNSDHSAPVPEHKHSAISVSNNETLAASTINPHCQAFFHFDADVNRQKMTGGVFWQGLGKQEKGNAFALHIRTEKPLNSTFAPFIVYVNDFGTYQQSDVPPALEEQSQQHLLAFFFAMQWSRENPKTERDAMGEYQVRYTGNQRKKGAYLAQNPVQTLQYSSQATLTPQSCYWDALETQEILSVAITEIGHRVRLNNHTLFTIAEPEDPLPFWLSGDYQQALAHVKAYQPDIKTARFQTPSDAELMALFNQSNRAQARSIILALLEHESFVLDFVAKLEANQSELSPSFIARIIALMSVKDSAVTQNAVLNLLSSDTVPPEHRFQAAVALGDFHHLYNQDIASHTFEQFQQPEQPAIFRSALIASLGRFAANIRHRQPQVYQHIVQQLFDELGTSNATVNAQSINESGILLDGIYNSKVKDPDLLNHIAPFAHSANPKNRARAAAIYASAKQYTQLGKIIAGENNPETKAAMLNNARLNKAEIEEVVAPFLVSEHDKVRTESLHYLAAQPSLNSTTEKILLHQFHHDAVAKNRGLIATIFKRHNKLHLLNNGTP